METIVLSENQLCNIISLAVMCTVDKHPNGDAAMYKYVKHNLAQNGVTPDVLINVAQHLRDCVIASRG